MVGANQKPRAGSGKSLLGCYWAIKMCIKYPGVRGLIGRAQLKALKETTFLTFLEVAKMQGIEQGKHFVVNNQTNIVYFKNGSMIFLKDLAYYPSDAMFDRFGSLEITFAFLDEIAQIPELCWTTIKSRIRYKLDEYNLKPTMLGTLNPSKNWVFYQFYKPWSEDSLPENTAFIRALPTDNKYLPESYVETLKNLTGFQYQRLFLGNWNFETVDGALFAFEDVQNIFSNVVEYGGEHSISVDVARHGVDKTVIMVWKGLRCFEIHIAFDNDINQVSERIEQIRKRYKVKMSRVVIDDGGIGGGVSDNFKGAFHFVSNKAAIEVRGDKANTHKNYSNLRAQCYFVLADLVKKGNIFLDIKRIHIFGDNRKSITLEEIKEQIGKELEHIRQIDFDKDTKIRIVAKDQLKQEIDCSPDFADCLMMNSVLELKPKKSYGQIIKERGGLRI